LNFFKKVLDLNHPLNHTPKTPKNNVSSMGYKKVSYRKKVLKIGGKEVDPRNKCEDDSYV